MDLAPAAAVIGAIFFVYVRMFNNTMQTYKDSDYTLTWDEFVRSHMKALLETSDRSSESRLVPEYESR
jgi:hypothetical protein